MNEHGKSDRSIVPAKQPNKDDAAAPSAEDMEGRDLTKGNAPQQNTPRTQCREGVQSALEAIRKAAKANKKMRFTALLHHVYNIENLREAFHGINRDASPGIDGETWESYEEELEANLRHLSDRLSKVHTKQSQ